MRKNIVTGATGFIGRALCRELLENNEHVIAVIRPGSKDKEKFKKLQDVKTGHAQRLEIVELELFDLNILYKQFRIEADCFYHLAWNGSSGPERDDFDIQNTNIAYMGEAVKAAKSCGCSRIVGAGSQAEYGICRTKASEEGTIPAPVMMYGAAKLASYQLGKVLAKQFGISFIWPRIYSIYGVGENSGTLVNYVMSCLLNEETPLISSCRTMWNYMYITDCARALRELGEKSNSGGIYNVASKDTRPLKEFVEQIRDIVAPGMVLNFDSQRDSLRTVYWLEPDTKKLYALDKHIPQTSFREGIKKKLAEESFEISRKCERL